MICSHLDCAPFAFPRSRGHGVHEAHATSVAACTHVRTRLAPETHRMHEIPQVLVTQTDSRPKGRGIL